MKKPYLRLSGSAFLSFAILATPAFASESDSYPARPVSLVVPFTPGGITDSTARLVASKLGERLGQTIVVENRPGAGGAIAGTYVARSAPDGYTLFFGSRGTQVTNAMIQKDIEIPPVNAFASVHGVSDSPTVLVAHPSAPFQDLKGMVEYAKKHPDKIAYATAGNGTAAHLTSALFMDVTGIKMTHVPYRGSAPAVQDLVAGTVNLAFDYPATTSAFIDAGRLRPLAVLYGERLPALPDVPTAAELGMPGAESSSWFAIFAPAKTTQPVLERLEKEMNVVMADESVRQKIIELGSIPMGIGAKEVDALIEQEAERWTTVLRRVPVTAN